jgi:hypothetical protein
MFNAAKDFVFTNSADGKTITSGGYRISKILGTTKKKQRGGRKKKEGDEEEEGIENFYNEESGIPMGLLHFGPKFFAEQEQEHAQSPRRKEDVEHNEDNIIELELVMPMPSSSSPSYNNVNNINNVNNCGLEDAKDVVDDDLFCKFLESASLADNGANNFHSERKMSRKRTLNKINLKNLKVDKVYARRKTRKH